MSLIHPEDDIVLHPLLEQAVDMVPLPLQGAMRTQLLQAQMHIEIGTTLGSPTLRGLRKQETSEPHDEDKVNGDWDI